MPDWRDGAGYAALLAAEPAALAWEWLRRDPLYRAAAVTAPRGLRSDRIPVIRADPAATPWGLHAFEDPDLPAHQARPVWCRTVYPRAVSAAAGPAGPSADLFDLARFAALATAVVADSGAEHLLLSDGFASVRIDVTHGSLLREPACLAYQLSGLAGLDGPLAALRALLNLHRTGHLRRPPHRSRNRRLVLLLRAHDALLTGATQREIAGHLLNAAALQGGWRAEAPSLRSQAQRLAGGARSMAKGGYRALLRA